MTKDAIHDFLDVYNFDGTTALWEEKLKACKFPWQM